MPKNNMPDEQAQQMDAMVQEARNDVRNGVSAATLAFIRVLNVCALCEYDKICKQRSDEVKDLTKKKMEELSIVAGPVPEIIRTAYPKLSYCVRVEDKGREAIKAPEDLCTKSPRAMLDGGYEKVNSAYKREIETARREMGLSDGSLSE